VLDQVGRRRTFAIISHPDAGKTTLTEKLLLYGGALLEAGAVRSRKNERATTSDWMELEKQRGISISSTVLQFDYDGHRLNLLDTPGHRDFSEDTYRVLTAVDSAVMVLDAAKGIEAQTRKLFEVCRRRGVPIFTFVNKLDRPGREPLDLLDEIEKVLGLHPHPMNWPLGMGQDFTGVYDRHDKRVHLFERTPGGAFMAPLEVREAADPAIAERMRPDDHAKFLEEIGLLDHVAAPFDAARVAAGDQSPVFFGSASNNFGVQLLLDGFLKHAPAPGPRVSTAGPVDPRSPSFSGFIFKVQGNMDPRHRDRVAFVRVCSGKFERDMQVAHSRTGKKIRLANSHRIFGRDREIVEEAYAGDILGLVGHADFAIGDTLSSDPAVVYEELPRFPPEVWTRSYITDPTKSKSYRKGLEQLMLEGVVQAFETPTGPVLAAVGPLQFEVFKFRLMSEYSVDVKMEPVSWHSVRWVDPADEKKLLADLDVLPSGAASGKDAEGRTVIFFPTEWSVGWFKEKVPSIRTAELPPLRRPAAA
jgi:peptide chain release factor 3